MSFDAGDPSTPNDTWTQDARFRALPSLDLDGVQSLIVLAAHPDDETLGAGGLVAALARRGVSITVVVATDGAASHEGGLVADLAAVRAAEVRTAVGLLGAAPPVLLEYPDGGVREAAEALELDVVRLVEAEATRLAAGSGGTAARGEAAAGLVVAAPWRGDGHRDHRVLGEIAAGVTAERGLRLVEYPIWLWHWGSPVHPAVPWPSLRAFELDADARAAKAQALAAFVSQTTPRGDAGALLRADFLEHFDRSVEVFVDEAAAARDGGTGSP